MPVAEAIALTVHFSDLFDIPGGANLVFSWILLRSKEKRIKISEK
jgi:hypothetical protein